MGFINGTAQDTFSPNSNIAREQFMKILLNTLGIVDSGAVCSFGDVNENDWFYPYVATAQKLGITKGFEDGTFGVGQDITRQDMVVLIGRALEIAEKAVEPEGSRPDFLDKDMISDYAIEAVGVLRQAGILNGDENGNFMPRSPSTRAEATKMLFEMYSRI